MAQATHHCIVCGKGYIHCNDCAKLKNINPWRAIACTPECYQAYLACLEYYKGTVDKTWLGEVLADRGFQGKKVQPRLQALFDEALGNPDVLDAPEMEATESLEVVESSLGTADYGDTPTHGNQSPAKESPAKELGESLE